jgi:uncharacterized membrane protein YdfJ with MMPL/SSD domain
VTLAFFAGLARLVVRFRVLVAAGWLVVLATAMLALPSLGSQTNSDPTLGLALGVLLGTFVVRTLLVPSAAVLLGRWNWWPSGPGERSGPVTSGAPAPASTR